MSASPRPAPDSPGTERRVAITGASGFIGRPLVEHLRGAGYRVQRLVRRSRCGPGEVRWDPERGVTDAAALEGVDAVIHLAGESLAQLWTARAKRRIRESRTRGTTTLARALASLAHPPRVLVTASGIGIYGDRGEEPLDASSAPGHDFLAEVGQAWEAAAQPAAEAGIRVAHSRFGLVLAPDGGALQKLLLPFRLGLGGRIGSGEQWLSWIARTDAVAALRFAIETDSLAGPFDAVAPEPVRNAEFAATLARVLHRPALFPVPAFAIRLVLGEMGATTLLASQRAFPARLQAAGFRFRYPTLEEALRAELGRPGAGTSAR